MEKTNIPCQYCGKPLNHTPYFVCSDINNCPGGIREQSSYAIHYEDKSETKANQ